MYLPESAGPHPTVLVRSPYGRGALASLPTALPYAARGYAVVLQSVRGTFGSGGEFEPVVNEAHDGRDTIAWLRGQDWFDGPLALLGLSYLAYSAWALALDPPKELAALMLHIGPHDLARAGMADGAFELASLATWTVLPGHPHQRSRSGDRIQPGLHRHPGRPPTQLVGVVPRCRHDSHPSVG